MGKVTFWKKTFFKHFSFNPPFAGIRAGNAVVSMPAYMSQSRQRLTPRMAQSTCMSRLKHLIGAVQRPNSIAARLLSGLLANAKQVRRGADWGQPAPTSAHKRQGTVAGCHENRRRHGGRGGTAAGVVATAHAAVGGAAQRRGATHATRQIAGVLVFYYVKCKNIFDNLQKFRKLTW